MWALKQFATWGVYSAHGDLFFLAGLSVIFTIAYVIDRRAAAQRASREDTGITEQQGKPLASSDYSFRYTQPRNSRPLEPAQVNREP